MRKETGSRDRMGGHLHSLPFQESEHCHQLRLRCKTMWLHCSTAVNQVCCVLLTQLATVLEGIRITYMLVKEVRICGRSLEALVAY